MFFHTLAGYRAVLPQVEGNATGFNTLDVFLLCSLEIPYLGVFPGDAAPQAK